MYMSDCFTEEQMTKYEILLDANKVWDKTLAYSTDLSSLCKAYGNNKAAMSRFESEALARDHTSTDSITTANTKSDFTCNLYIELGLLRFRHSHLHTHITGFYPVTLLQTKLVQSNASWYWKSWHRMKHSWQHSPRVTEAAAVRAAEAAEAKAAAATMAVSTIPH